LFALSTWPAESATDRKPDRGRRPRRRPAREPGSAAAPPRAEIIEPRSASRKAAKSGRKQLDQREREEHRERRDQHRFAEELDDQLLAIGAEHLAQRDLAGALAGAGGGEVGEVDAGHAEDEQGDDREGAIVRRSLPGRHRAILGLAEMDVADVDEAPVLLVAGALNRARRRTFSSGMLRFSQAGSCG
jgi:hypothetical protein